MKKNITQLHATCVRCNTPVKVGVGPGTGHVGHVDKTLDATCKRPWGYVYKKRLVEGRQP